MGCGLAADPALPSGDTEAGDASSSETGPHEPESSCAEPPACDPDALCQATTCGGKVASINHFGCTRPTCESDADCPAEERCYPRAMGASCLSSTLDCEATELGCQCAVTNDCNGIFGAHCLPAEFYPVDGYCDPTAFECPDLPAWHDALRSALTQHDQGGRDQLSVRLSACSTSVVDARIACGESMCAVACQLSSCPDVETNACVAACEASPLDDTSLAVLVAQLAAIPGETCGCELCEGDGACTATWGC